MGNIAHKKNETKSFSRRHIPKVMENKDNIAREYRMEHLIKRVDQYYSVYTCTNIKTKIKYAMRKYHTGKDKDKSLMKELKFYDNLDHPYVFSIIEYFISKNNLFVIMDYFNGKNLSDYILEAVKFEEEEIVKIIRQLLTLLNYIHGQGIVNRNISLKNLMYDGNNIKLLGFKRAAFLKGSNKFLKEQVIPIHYRAPEVIKKKYGFKADVWAVGVIAYVLLTGEPPFEGPSLDKTEKEILYASLNEKLLLKYKVSRDAIDFLNLILTKDREARPGPEQLLEHKWLSENKKRPSDLKLNENIIKNLQRYNYNDRFQSSIYSFLVSRLVNENEKKNVFKEFQKLDTKGNGVLTKSELREGLKGLSLSIVDDEIDQIFHRLDQNKTGVIEYSYFLEAVIDRDQFLQEENLTQYFDYLDYNKNGGLTLFELERIFGGMIKSKYIKKKFLKYSNKAYINKEGFIKMLREITI